MLGEDLTLFGVRDRVLLLRSLPDLLALGEDDLALIAEDARVRRFRVGEPLFERHRPVDRIFILDEGSVRFRRHGEDIAPLLGATVGLVSLLAGDDMGTEAIAAEEVVALELPAEAVFRNMQESFAITRNTVRLLAREFLGVRGDLPVGAPIAPALPPQPAGKPRTMVEKLLLLRSTPLGAMASLEAAAELVSAMTEVRLSPGEVLWAAGEAPTFWVRIEEGEVSCIATDGRSVRVGPGSLLGELDGWADRARGFEVRAEMPVVALRMELSAHVAVLEAHAETAAALTMFLARRLLETVCSAPHERPNG